MSDYDIIREFIDKRKPDATDPPALLALERMQYAVEHCAEAEKPTLRPCVQRVMRLKAELDDWKDIVPLEIGTPGLVKLYIEALHRAIDDNDTGLYGDWRDNHE